MDTIIVGAGGGGIASALLASLRGENVSLLEGHSNLGGCASFFSRGNFHFDVGATTLSGLAPHQPLGTLFKLLGRQPELVAVDPGIVFHLSRGQKLSYYCDFEKWMAELERVFPGKNHRPFWSMVRNVSDEAWHFLKDVSSPLAMVAHPRYIKLLPHLLVSTEMMLKKNGLDDPAYRELIDGILLISAQAESEHIPFLVGAMALSYPAETFAPLGGMKGLMDFFEKVLQERKVSLQKKTLVVSVNGDDLILKNGQPVHSDRVIFNLPVWNLSQLLDLPDLNREAQKRPETWGAFTLYLSTKSQIAEPYHQIHLNHALVKNYFVSFSLIQDTARAPVGQQVVTISTHVGTGEWFNLPENEYWAKKEQVKNLILQDFLSRFGINESHFFSAGTPKTFEDYTGRFHGHVGGLPFLYGMNPLPLMGIKELGKDWYRVGDTVFPGQGLCGVVAGALRLHWLLSKKGLSHQRDE